MTTVDTTARRTGVAGTLLGLAVITSALIAGLWYTFVVTIMIALGDLDDHTFVLVMNRINVVIQNPAFFATFMGAPVLTAAAAVLQWRFGSRTTAWWVVAAVVLHVVVLAVTAGINIPLNNDLAAAGNSGTIVDPAGAREKFEDPWNAWNTVRFVVGTAAVACLGRALVLHGRVTRRLTEHKSAHQ